MNYDPITQDPPITDKAYPATMMPVRFSSHGAYLNGIMYLPQGNQPNPTILLLHGFPGLERNFDLAQIFRRAGFNVMVFHYRGAWGSEGRFAFRHVLEDTVAAVDFLREPAIVESYRIDPERITAIGHSMGGWTALHLAGAGHVQKVASIAGANIGLWGELAQDSAESRAYSTTFFESSLPPLHGTSAETLLDEVITHLDDFDYLRHAKSLSQKDVLLVAGERDDGVPASLHHTPLVTLIEKQGASRLTHTILDTDHGFNDKRIALARLVLDWLQS